jgi:hypothetical protein
MEFFEHSKITIWNLFFARTFKHNNVDHDSVEPLEKHKPIEYPKPDGKLTFDLLSSVALAGKLYRIVEMLVWENTCCLFQVKFITEYTNVQHVIFTRI